MGCHNASVVVVVGEIAIADQFELSVVNDFMFIIVLILHVFEFNKMIYDPLIGRVSANLLLLKM